MIRMATDPSAIGATLKAALENTVRGRIDVFVQAGEAAMEIAYSNDAYQNVSGDLRASIGYGAFLNGAQVAEGGFQQTDGSDNGSLGVQTGKEFLHHVASAYTDGVVLIIVAGMDYAVKKESEGTPVITDAALFAESFIRNALQ